MECQECMERISEFIDDELSIFEYEQIKEHLLSCQDCQNVAEEFQFLHDCLKQSIEAIPVSVNLDQRILISLQQELQKVTKQRVFSFLVLGLLGSSLLLLFPLLLRIVQLFYATGYALWRAKTVFVMLLPSTISWVIGIASILLCVIGIYMIRTLLQGSRFKEVSL